MFHMYEYIALVIILCVFSFSVDVRGLFVPPAYFSGLTAALKQPLVPPFWGPPNSSDFPSLPTEPDVPLRPGIYMYMWCDGNSVVTSL